MDFAYAYPTTPQIAPAPWSPPELRLVCLDIDDTLIDYTAAIRFTLGALTGRPDMWPLWDLITEEHVAMVVAGEIDYATMHHRRTECFLAEMGVLAAAEDVADFERRRRELLARSFRLFDDVLPCLDWLRAVGVLIAAVTNASGVHQRRKIAETSASPRTSTTSPSRASSASPSRAL